MIVQIFVCNSYPRHRHIARIHEPCLAAHADVHFFDFAGFAAYPHIQGFHFAGLLHACDYYYKKTKNPGQKTLLGIQNADILTKLIYDNEMSISDNVSASAPAVMWFFLMEQSVSEPVINEDAQQRQEKPQNGERQANLA